MPVRATVVAQDEPKEGTTVQEPWNSIVIATFIIVLLLVFILILDNQGVIFIRPMLGG